ncbi:MAG TPA: N-acetyltransferase, partial [Bacteroidales bacterium]|nr:N-acetyltransferase [Bacteroidales bacterium]
IDYYIKMYFSFIVLDFISVVVDEHDKVAAFGITMPSLSKAVQKSGGKILPFGFIHILRAMKKNDTVDFYLTAVRPELQGKGVNALLFIDLIPKYRKFGIKKAESNVELENNQMVRRQWDMFPKRQHKRRRAYIKHI